MKIQQTANNHFILNTNDLLVFQSYQTIVAIYDQRHSLLYIDEFKYSRTTSKHLNKFIKEHTIANQTFKVNQEFIQNYLTKNAKVFA
jgi:hypothetical protein